MNQPSRLNDARCWPDRRNSRASGTRPVRPSSPISPAAEPPRRGLSSRQSLISMPSAGRPQVEAMVSAGSSGRVYWNEWFSVMPKAFCVVTPISNKPRTSAGGTGEPPISKALTRPSVAHAAAPHLGQKIEGVRRNARAERSRRFRRRDRTCAARRAACARRIRRRRRCATASPTMPILWLSGLNE